MKKSCFAAVRECVSALEPRMLMSAVIDQVTPPPGRFNNAFQRWTSTSQMPDTGSLGHPLEVSYSFVPDGTFIPGDITTGEPGLTSILAERMRTAFNTNSDSVWQARFRSAIESWGTTSGVHFVYEPNDDGAVHTSAVGGIPGVRGDIRIGGRMIDGVPTSGSNTLAHCAFPSDGGDVVMDTSDMATWSDSTNNYRKLRNVVAHEIGHGLGLEHVVPSNGTKLMEPTISTAYDGPQFHDVWAINRNYGDRLEGTVGNDSTDFATDLLAINAGSQVSEFNNLSLSSSADVDYYRVILIHDAHLTNVTASPIGGTYPTGAQSPGISTAFNAATQLNMKVELLDVYGAVIKTADQWAEGSPESLGDCALRSGVYFIRVTGANTVNTPGTQMYNLAVGYDVRPVLFAYPGSELVASPRSTPASSTSWDFNIPINPNSVHLSDFTLTRDGQAIPLTGAGWSITNAGYTLTLTNLQAATNRIGDYSVTLNAGSLVSTSFATLENAIQTPWIMRGLVGTNGSDNVELQYAGGTSVKVWDSNAGSFYTFDGAAIPDIDIDLAGGDDTLTVMGYIHTDISHLDGGTGADTIYCISGPTGSNYLVGNHEIYGATSISGVSNMDSIYLAGISSAKEFITVTATPPAPLTLGTGPGDTLDITGGSPVFTASALVSVPEVEVMVRNGAAATFSGAVSFGSLLITGATVSLAPAATSVLRTRTLTITSGKLNLVDGALIVDYPDASPSPASTVRNLLANGRGDGTWNGAVGITSSTIVPGSSGTVGYGEASEMYPTFSATFAGQSIDSSSVLVRRTIAGDANLDRSVDFSDLLILAQNYGSTGRSFARGDFDYDPSGSVDFSDLLLLAQAYGTPAAVWGSDAAIATSRGQRSRMTSVLR